MMLDLEGCGDLFMTTIRMMTVMTVMIMMLLMVWLSSWQICGMQQ